MGRYDRSVSLIDSTGNPINIGNPLPTTGSGGGGGGAVTVADGADVCQGSTTDLAVTGDTAGTISAKLRGINKILFDVWDSVSHLLRVSVSNFPATQPVSGTVAVSNFPGTQPVSGTVTANQGTPNSAANSWPVEMTDGTNVLGTSSHPLRTDPTGATPQPVTGTVTTTLVGNSWTDRSGTIAAGGTSQQLMAANSSRQSWIIQNTGTGVLWINFGIAAVQSEPSLKVPVGGGYEEGPPGNVSPQQINIIGATTAQSFTAKEA